MHENHETHQNRWNAWSYWNAWHSCDSWNNSLLRRIPIREGSHVSVLVGTVYKRVCMLVVFVFDISPTTPPPQSDSDWWGEPAGRFNRAPTNEGSHSIHEIYVHVEMHTNMEFLIFMHMVSFMNFNTGWASWISWKRWNSWYTRKNSKPWKRGHL